ncbi:MAG: LPS export ABC transporter periplasmic protein LptC [Chitinophagaceae bacterium]
MINRFFYKTFLQAALFTGCLFVLGCENSQRELDRITKKKQMVEEAKDVQSIFSQQGVLKAKLKAPIMLRYQGDTALVVFPKTLHVDFFDPSGKQESKLDALYGRYLENMNKVLLRDSVVVINVKGDTLKTPELWWDQNQRKFYTDSTVIIATKDKHLYGGKGLEAAQDISWYIIKQPTGVILVADSTMNGH